MKEHVNEIAQLLASEISLLRTGGVLEFYNGCIIKQKHYFAGQYAKKYGEKFKGEKP